MRDNNTILRETLRELHDMMLIKGNDTPDKTWTQKYNFLIRRRDHFRKKSYPLNGTNLIDNLLR